VLSTYTTIGIVFAVLGLIYFAMWIAHSVIITWLSPDRAADIIEAAGRWFPFRRRHR
jgi:hypothetical protein